MEEEENTEKKNICVDSARERAENHVDISTASLFIAWETSKGAKTTEKMFLLSNFHIFSYLSQLMEIASDTEVMDSPNDWTTFGPCESQIKLCRIGYIFLSVLSTSSETYLVWH